MSRKTTLRLFFFARKEIILGEAVTAAAIIATATDWLWGCLFNANDACFFGIFLCFNWQPWNVISLFLSMKRRKTQTYDIVYFKFSSCYPVAFYYDYVWRQCRCYYCIYGKIRIDGKNAQKFFFIHSRFSIFTNGWQLRRPQIYYSTEFQIKRIFLFDSNSKEKQYFFTDNFHFPRIFDTGQ